MAKFGKDFRYCTDWESTLVWNGQRWTIDKAMKAGAYGLKAHSDLLIAKNSESHPTEKADLFGKRLVVVSETESGGYLSERVAKELSGNDTIAPVVCARIFGALSRRIRWLFARTTSLEFEVRTMASGVASNSFLFWPSFGIRTAASRGRRHGSRQTPDATILSGASTWSQRELG